SATGATRADSAIDIDGGLATLATFARIASRELSDEHLLLDGPSVSLSRRGGFVGQHIYVARRGVALQINAFNFPVWGMLEKLAPAYLAGMPTIVKPATPTAYIAQHAVR